jgi:hypothetical protein
MGHATFDHIQVRSGTPHENAEGVLNETSRWDVEIDGLQFHVIVLELGRPMRVVCLPNVTTNSCLFART